MLAAIIFCVIEILDVLGLEKFISLSVIVLIMSIANIFLLFKIGENYLIIAECYFVILAISSIIGAVMCYNRVATGLQVLNIILLIIILLIINGGAYLLLVFGSNEFYRSIVQLVFDKA